MILAPHLMETRRSDGGLKEKTLEKHQRGPWHMRRLEAQPHVRHERLNDRPVCARWGCACGESITEQIRVSSSGGYSKGGLSEALLKPGVLLASWV